MNKRTPDSEMIHIVITYDQIALLAPGTLYQIGENSTEVLVKTTNGEVL